MKAHRRSGISWNAGKLAGLFVAAIVALPAATVTLNLSVPVTYVSPTDVSKLSLLDNPSIGDVLHASISYDGAMTPIQTLPGFLNFIPPADTGSATVSLNAFSTHYTDNYFQAIFRPDYTNEINGRLAYGDDAVFFSYGPPVSASNPRQTWLYEEVMFPHGTFHGTANLPDLAPSWEFLSFEVDDGQSGRAVVQSLGEIGAGLSPVPEPATYGAAGALALLGLVAAKKLRRARQLPART